MGMFTTISDDLGNSVQIKCGWDDLEEYKVGDTVNWRIIPDSPGSVYLPDDVYLGIGGKDSEEAIAYEDWWVVIKNHVVLEMFPYEEGDTYPELKARYRIQDPPEDLWPAELWAEKREREARVAAEMKEFEESIAHLSRKDRLAALAARVLKTRLDYSSVSRSLFGVDPMPESAKPIYSFEDVRPKGEPITCAKPDRSPVKVMTGESEGIHPPHGCGYTRRVPLAPEADLGDVCPRLDPESGEIKFASTPKTDPNPFLGYWEIAGLSYPYCSEDGEE